MLMESETTKLRERDEKHHVQMGSWKAELGPRKKVGNGVVISITLPICYISDHVILRI